MAVFVLFNILISCLLYTICTAPTCKLFTMKYLFYLVALLPVMVCARQQKPLSVAAIEYRQPDSLRAAQFYTELIVSNATKGYYGISFSKGKLILDVKKEERRIIFKLQDEVIADAKLISVGLHVDTAELGKVAWKYDWKIGSPYKFLITTLADSASQATQYAGYVLLPETQQWKYMATWQIANDGNWLHKPAIILGTQKLQKKIGAQKLKVEQAWLQRNNGTWQPLTQGVYVSNMKGDAGTDSGKPFIAGAPFVMSEGSSGTIINATAFPMPPYISVTNQTDSLEQASIDKATIIQTLKLAGADTTMQTNHVYYTMLKEGTGNTVNVTDTVTVFYKGSLLKDGSVFDATKDKPATFPLSRLIKGWQYALVKCKVGGKVRVYIPSGLAYSTRLRGKNIPPNSILVFDIEVMESKKKI